MREIDPVIIRTAELVREHIELFVMAQSPVNFDAENLQGACGISSRVLSRSLTRLGVQNDFVMGQWGKCWDDNDNHCWVEVPRLGVIVDVTATQFGVSDKVHVTTRDDPNYRALRKNASATRRFTRWEGQSYVWYEDRLRYIEGQVVYEVQNERRLNKVA